MSLELPDLIEDIRRNRTLFTRTEEATKQGVVLPLLGRLGWNRDNIAEVEPEYSAGKGRVDYCLRQGDIARVFVEVKKLDEPLDKHQEQLLRYAFEEGVKIAALTDGMRWWLYLPTQEGSWEQRRFFTIDLEGQSPSDVAMHLRTFLEKQAVLNGAAEQAARKIHASRAKDRQIRDAIPLAWREICEGPDPRLIELLSEKVEGRCGHKPDPDLIEEYIVIASGSPPPPCSSPQEKLPNQIHRPNAPSVDPPWTFRKPVSFTFLGQRHQVSRFKDILLTLAKLLHDQHPGQFWSKVGELQSNRGKHYYTREPDQLQEPREIGGSGIWMETCFSANAVKDRCRELLVAFGHAPENLHVELLPAIAST